MVLNTARKSDSSLSHWLRRLVEGSGLERRLREIGDLDALNEFEEQLPAALAGMRPKPPALGRMRSADVREDQGAWVDGEIAGYQQSTTRYYVAVEVLGDHRLLTFWPDAEDSADLVPVDAQILEDSKSWRHPFTPTQRAALTAADETWMLSETGRPFDNSGEWALYTYVDLTVDQEEAAGHGQAVDPFALVSAKVEEATPIVEAIARQTARYFDDELPLEFAQAIKNRRGRIEARARVSAMLKFPNEWTVAKPQLAQPNVVAPTSTAVQQTEAEALTAEAEGDVEIRVDVRARLAPATFDDVQRVIRVWADGMERYPAAFTDMDEDRISDLLTATLNATLPGANREVYSREGKSDIFIQADVLAAGTGPAKVFICENKWARTDKIVKEAVDPQLFGYLTVRDTAAVLLLLMDQVGFDRPVTARLKALREVAGFIGEKEGPSGWPIFEYEHEGRRVELCIATVHIPKPRKERKPAGASPSTSRLDP